MAKKIAIFYITPSSGHYKAAKALKMSSKLVDKQAEVLNIDSLRYLHPISEKVVNFFYTLIIKKIPFVWGGVYDKKNFIDFLSIGKRFVHYLDRIKLKKMFNRINPEVVICTQGFPCGVVASYKKYVDPKIKLIACITDLLPHSLWVYDEVDYYTVANQKAKEYLISKGVDADKIKTTGIPIMPTFRQNYSKQEVAEQFGFNSSMDTVLLMGGGSGLGPLKDIARYLDILDIDIQMIVVCGRNQFLYNWFMKNKRFFKKKMHIFGYVDHIDKFMEFSDIIVTKPGGITISEALSKRLAIVIINPIPGQEQRNMKYLVRNKASLKADNPYQAALIIKTLLKNHSIMEELKENGLALSKPNAALDVMRLAIDL